jgi:hypothetical protein
VRGAPGIDALSQVAGMGGAGEQRDCECSQRDEPHRIPPGQRRAKLTSFSRLDNARLRTTARWN